MNAGQLAWCNVGMSGQDCVEQTAVSGAALEIAVMDVPDAAHGTYSNCERFASSA